VNQGRSLARVDGNRGVEEANPPHVVPVVVAEEYRVNLRLDILQRCVLKCPLGVQAGNLWEEAELEEVACAIDVTRLNPSVEVVGALVEARPKVEEDLGVLVLKKELVAADLADGAITGQTGGQSKRAVMGKLLNGLLGGRGYSVETVDSARMRVSGRLTRPGVACESVALRYRDRPRETSDRPCHLGIYE